MAPALVALCAGLLPVWGRHLATSRAQSEVAVSEMLRAFSDIGPHINMAERQSRQINDALVALPAGEVTGLVGVCEQVLAPALADANLSLAHKAAITEVLGMVRKAVGALEIVARPFQQETHIVAQQVDRMYMGFQYQDRISQMMALLEADMRKLQQALQDGSAQTPDLAEWLVQLESQYAMAEQHHDHAGAQPPGDGSDNGNETTFF